MVQEQRRTRFFGNKDLGCALVFRLKLAFARIHPKDVVFVCICAYWYIICFLQPTFDIRHTFRRWKRCMFVFSGWLLVWPSLPSARQIKSNGFTFSSRVVAFGHLKTLDCGLSLHLEVWRRKAVDCRCTWKLGDSRLWIAVTGPGGYQVEGWHLR